MTIAAPASPVAANHASTEGTTEKRERWMWLGAFALVFAAYVFRLNYPHALVYDEIYDVGTARTLLAHGSDYNSIQPPLGIVMISASIALIGDNTWAWRLPSLLAGVGCLVALYVIARALTREVRTARLVVLLMALDGLFFTQARIGMVNTIVLGFSLASVAVLVRAVDRRSNPWVAGALAAALWGLALVTKWTAATVGAPLALAYFALVWRAPQGKRWKTALGVFGVMTVVSVVVYLGVFIVLALATGHDVAWVKSFHINNTRYHLELTATHRYGSQWWSWPLLIRPIWYYYRPQEWHGQQIATCIISIGNPVIYLGVPFALAWCGYKQIRDKSFAHGFLLVSMLSQWMAWAALKRVQFFHYYVFALPYSLLALSLGLEALSKRAPWGKWVVIGFMVLVVISFGYWYPLLAALPVHDWYWQQHMWLPGWT